MPRRKMISTFDAQIEAQKKKIATVKRRYDELCEELIVMQEERDKALALEVVNAMKQSGRTYRELMTFLGQA